MYPWAVLAQCFRQSYFILPKALSSYDHFGMKEGSLTAALWDPFRCVQVKTENSPALSLFSCRSASFSLWGRARFAVPAVTQAKGCSHLLLPFPQWAVSEGTSQALPLPPALDGHLEEKDEAKFPPRTSGTGFSPQSWSWSNTAAQIQGSHRLLEGRQGGMRARPRSAVSYYHMLQQTCGGFFPAYSLQAYHLILLISVGNVMSRWICPLIWYFRQRLIYVYLIIGNAFLNLISFGWFPIYPHIHTQKKRTKSFWLLYFVYVTSMVQRGWWGFFCRIRESC